MQSKKKELQLKQPGWGGGDSMPSKDPELHSSQMHHRHKRIVFKTSMLQWPLKPLLQQARRSFSK